MQLWPAGKENVTKLCREIILGAGQNVKTKRYRPSVV